MSEPYIAKEYCMSRGVGMSNGYLASFDKALLDAGVGNYNLVRLSSILPANCEEVSVKEIANHIQEGSLLPTAYSVISSKTIGERIAASIAIGFPKDRTHVCVIMEYSNAGITEEGAALTVTEMVKEAFAARGWELDNIKVVTAGAIVSAPNTQYTAFACVSEW